MECLSCRYSLVGLERGECPECGREFDPGDRSTFGPRTFAERFDHLVLPPALAWVMVLLAVTLLVLFSSPDGRLRDSIDLVPVVFVWFWSLVMCAAVAVVAIRFICDHKPRQPSNWRSLILFAITGVLYVVCWRTGAIFWLRWHYAKPAFVAARLLEDGLGSFGTPKLSEPRWFGTFYVTGVTRFKPATDCGSGGNPLVFEMRSSEWYSNGGVDVVYDPLNATSGQAETALDDDWRLNWDDN